MTSLLSNQRGRQRGHQIIPTLDPEVPGYSAVVEAISGLFAYWRFSDPGIVRDKTLGARHGTYDGPVSIVGSLPVDSGDGATSFPGTVVGTVPPAGLSLPQFTLSLWVQFDSLQTGVVGRILIVTKDQSGLIAGDLSLAITEDGELSLYMQETGAEHSVGPVDVSGLVGTPIHLIGLAGTFGFELWVNGRKIDTNTSFTTGWTSNSQPLRFCGAPFATNVFRGVLDECALYNRVLTDTEIISLSQQTGPPVAVNDSALVQEGASVTVNVIANDQWVGRETNLTVQVYNGSTWGSSATTTLGIATVESDKQITFLNNVAISADVTHNVPYRIIDQTGTSNTAVIAVDIENVGGSGGGTLVYDFQPQPAWIDNGSMTVAGATKVPLANRDTNDAIGVVGSPEFDPADQPNPNRWRLPVASGGGVITGSSLAQATWNKNTQPVCWNRAPTGHPSLEMYTVANARTVVDFAIKLYDHFDANGPRHMRVVMEVRLCRSTDPTTYKAHGVGPTSGSYPNFSVTHEEGFSGEKASIKYFCQIFQGERHEGPVLCNHWNTPSLPIRRVGHMMNTGAFGKSPSVYSANFDRPGTAGESHGFGVVKITDNNMYGTWQRLELEVKLTTPSLVPTDARRSNPPTNPNPHSCDGFIRCYVTADIDGERGPTGPRTLSGELTGLLFDCRFDDMAENLDNMHILNNLVGPWLNWHYGGSVNSQGAGWSWLRRLQVHRLDGVVSGGEFVTTPEIHGWAAGNTVAQNTTAFQAAVAAADAGAAGSSTGRGVVQLVPSKVYEMTCGNGSTDNSNGCVTMNASLSNVEIRTQGTPVASLRAILRFTSWASQTGMHNRALVLFDGATNCWLTHVRLDGNKWSVGTSQATAETKLGQINYASGNNGGINNIAMQASSGCRIEHVESYDALVDGMWIDIINVAVPPDPPNANRTASLLVQDCDFHHNRRQGLSLISGGQTTATWDQLVFRRCLFRETGDETSTYLLRGQKPGFGVDIEPNNVWDRLYGITFDDCDFYDNHGATYTNGTIETNSAGRGLSLDMKDFVFSYFKVMNCQFRRNRNEAFLFFLRDGGDVNQAQISNNYIPPTGHVDDNGTNSIRFDQAGLLTNFLLSNNDVPLIDFLASLPDTGHSVTVTTGSFDPIVNTNGQDTITVDGGGSGEPTPPSTVVNVTTSSGLTFINNIAADRTIQFADGIYNLLGAIVPKSGQYYRGNLTNPAAVELRGTGNFRAFYGAGALAPGCVIKSIKITGYDCGMGRAFVPNPTGDNQDGRATLGAIEQASGWQILDCHVMNNYCSGMTIGNGTRVARCLINSNGHKGIGGGTENNNCRGRNLVIEDNQIDNNCRFDMNKTWDSGGIKVIGGATPGSPPANPALNPARNNVFRRNRISNNNGPGIWWDWDVFDGEIANNSIFLNHASGIVIEASATAHIHHNQIGDNCRGSLPALVTFRANTVGVQNSKRCLIEDNLFYVNREHASALTQHNRNSGPTVFTPKGGIYVGWFTGVENEWKGNVWLMQTNGAFTAQFLDHSCSNNTPTCTGVSCSFMCGTAETGCVITSAPSGPTIGGNFMCFIPQAAQNHLNVQDGDTFRIASGTANKWSFHTNSTQITESISAFIPNWNTIPTWTTPPGLAGSGIPANALDRSAYGSTAAWIAAMTSQAKPGKVGSGVYEVPPRTVLTQSIYGYGVTKPIFRGPSSAAKAASFLYPQAQNIRVTNVAFEDINMPFISSDDTVDDDWGDAMIPSSGYSWNYAEYSLLRYNATVQNLQIDNCNFTRCGVCVMLVGHFRIHDGISFTDNFVRNGMGCVTILGYHFRNLNFSRNDIGSMVGSNFGGSSANHTETLFMIGGINNPLDDAAMATNSLTVSDNTVVGFTSSHAQNNKNGAVYLDVRGGGNILSERNHVENCYSTGGTQDCNAVYLKSRGNIRFRNNLYRNCGSRPVDAAANHGSESQFYTFKGDTTDVISEDDVFETGPQCGNSPWIQAGTATDFTMVRPIFRGWRNDGTWWGRPGVPCLMHHWEGDRFSTVDAVLENCGWTGTQAYAVAHRDRAGGGCSHTGMRADFNGNATAIIGKGSGTATVTLTNCQNTIGGNLTVVTGLP